MTACCMSVNTYYYSYVLGLQLFNIQSTPINGGKILVTRVVAEPGDLCPGVTVLGATVRGEGANIPPSSQ